MNGIEMAWFDIRYAAEQVFYHLPREYGVFWWMIISAMIATIGSGVLLFQRLARGRRERRRRALMACMLGMAAPRSASAPLSTRAGRWQPERALCILAAVIFATSLGADVRAQDPAPADLAAIGPLPRYGHAMAYDSARGRVVLFGGTEDNFSSSYFGDTWEWDGTSWTLVSSTGPAPRRYVAMAYDSARACVVLFGGVSNVNPYYLGDTWEWDGTSWTLRSTTGPAPRDEHAMAYDSARGRVVLFGGFYRDSAYHYLGETWEWDGASWTLRSNAGPKGRTGHAMAFDSARGRTVLFGGFSAPPGFGEPAVYGDTWEWDGASWKRRTNSGPAPRYGNAATYDSVRRRVVLFGGGSYRTAIPSDTWEWDGASWTLRSLTGPSTRYQHAMACDSVRGRVVMFGGYGTYYLGDTWEWDGASWMQR